MRSPHFSFDLAREEIATLDRYLVDRKYLGSTERLLADEAAAMTEPIRTPSVGLQWPRASSEALVDAWRPSRQHRSRLAASSLLIEHEIQPQGHDEWHGRTCVPARRCCRRSRCCETRTPRMTSEPLSRADLSGAVRRWIEGQTFSPRLGPPASC